MAFGLNVCLKDRIPIPDKRSVSISLARQDFSQIRSETLGVRSLRKKPEGLELKVAKVE